MKIGPVDPEIILLKLKKEEINASKIYSPVGKCAERVNLSDSVFTLHSKGSEYCDE